MAVCADVQSLFENKEITMPKLLINADDFGLNPEVNEAIIRLLKDGRIQRTTLMVGMPYAEDAVKLLNDNNLNRGGRIGLHLNVGDGPALTEGIRNSEYCTDGEFNDSYEYYRFTRLYLSPRRRRLVKEELSAQFEKYKELLGHYPEHVDGHRHFHNLLPYLFIVMDLAKKYGVKSMRIPINLYDRTEAGFFKKAYKRVVVGLVKRNFRSTDYMGSFYEYSDWYNDSDDKTVEIMVHPTIKNGKIVDINFDNPVTDYVDFDLIKKNKLWNMK